MLQTHLTDTIQHSNATGHSRLQFHVQEAFAMLHLWVLTLTWPPVAVGTMIVVLSAAWAAGVMLAVEPWTTSCLSRLPDAAPFL